jgi:uncharacterized membrane protein
MVHSIVKILFYMLALDSVYLYLTKSLFSDMVTKIQKTAMQIRMGSAVIVYLLIATGLYYFIIKQNRSIWEAGLLGLVIYGTFDFTNYAMFKNYDLLISLMDTAWGAILFASVAYLCKLW